MPRRALFLMLLLGACEPDPATDKGTETGLPDDTGEDETGDPVAEGCITVDGGGGYALISDAIAAAGEGSLVSLCAGTYDEAVVIDKALTLEGPGLEDTTIVAPTNQPAIKIEADGVTVRGVALESTRSGVAIDGFADARLVSMGFLAVSNYGIEAKDAEALSIESCVFNATAYGGVQVDGGTANVVDSTFNDNVAFGIKAVGGATLSASNNTITATVPTDPSDATDGHGIWVVESEATITDNVLTDNAFVGIYGESSELQLIGGSVTGSSLGVAHILSELYVSGLTLTDNYSYGLYAYTESAVTIEGLTVSGAADLTASVPSDKWGNDRYGYSGVGVELASPEVVLSDITVDGYNNAGIFLLPFDTAGVATLTDITLSNNGRTGLYVSAVDLDATNVVVQDLIDVEEGGDEQCYTVGSNAAVTLLGNSTTWTGGGILNNDGYGIAALSSVLSIEGATLSGNSCAGVMNFGGALVATGNTVTASNGGSFEAGLVSYQGSSATIVNNSFVDNQVWSTTYDYEYDDGAGNIYHYLQYGYVGADIQIWYGGTNTISNNSFVTGTDSILAYDSDVEIEDNTWEDYRGVVFQASTSTSATMTIKNATVDGFYSYGAYCGSATMEISDSRFTGGGTYYYEFYAYLNDADYYSYTSSYANQTLYGYQCSMILDDVEITDTEGGVLTGSGGSYEINGLEADSVGASGSSGSDAIYFSSYSYYYYDTSTGSESTSFYEVEAWLRDVTITNVLGGNALTLNEAIYEYNGTGADDPETVVHIDGLTMSGIADSAIRFEASGNVVNGPEGELSDVAISGADLGIYGAYALLTLDGVSIDEISGEGVTLGHADLVATNLTITGAGSDAISANYGTVDLQDSTLTGSGGSGMILSSLTASVTGNTMTGNAEYGMSCSSVVFESCGNDLSGNDYGALDGCDASCEVPE